MLNYLHFGKEKVIKSEVQPGDTDTSYSGAEALVSSTDRSNCNLLLRTLILLEISPCF